MAFTDIRKKTWIECLPQAMRPYAYAMRLDRPIGWWLLLLPSWWGILMASPEITGQTAFLMGLFWVGAILMRGAGCMVNDLWDRDLDRKVERTASRPIASGQISVEDASIFLVILSLCGLAILFCLPLPAILLGFLSVPLIILYPLMKRYTWWPQAFLGLTFNFGALIGWSAVTGDYSLLSVGLYLACFFWTIGYDTVYAHQDKDDDLKVGIKSTALLFGDKSRACVYGFYIVAMLLFIGIAINSPLSWSGFIMLLLSFAYGGYRLAEWNPDDQESSLRMFRDNRDIGLLITIGLVI